MRASFEKRTFHFKQPSGTSRGVLTEKHTWFITVWDELNPSVKGVGECSIIPNLSPDFKDFESYEQKLSEVCKNLDEDLTDWPSIKFGVETALLDLKNGGQHTIFKNAFSKGKQRIPINGLVWMGDHSFMQKQVDDLLSRGFKTIKMKIGAIDFKTEYAILKSIRDRYTTDEITLRVDANGAFDHSNVNDRLVALKSLDIHSIEQPIKAGQWLMMKELCDVNIVPIALDEELIGINSITEKVELLETIQPQFIILKPSLHGGITGTQDWIRLADERNIRWWLTSALESNIGLNAICQLAAEYENDLPQGLGTGSLYTNNIPFPLVVEDGTIFLDFQ